MKSNETQSYRKNGNKEISRKQERQKQVNKTNKSSLRQYEKKDNIQVTNIWNGRDDITTVIKQIREYWELYVNKFNHLDKME